MMEVWLQITCNGCGTTTNSDTPCLTRKEFMDELKPHWIHLPGDLHYCRICRADGTAKKRGDIFRDGEET